MSKVALTGSTGMVGRYMSKLLENKHYRVIEINRSIWDLSEWKSFSELDDIFMNIEAIFHFAAYTPLVSTNENNFNHSSIAQLFDVNIRSCTCLAEWASIRNIPVMFLSGATVYRNPHALNILESNEKTTDSFGGFYGFSKYMAEQFFDHFMAKGLQAVLLRPSSIYGTGMPVDRLVATFVNTAKQGDVIKIIEPISNKVNFVHASDVANAALLAFEAGAWGTYNIAGSSNITINKLANYCVELVGSGSVEVIKNDNKRNAFTRFDLNYERARNQFGYRPKVDIKDGVKSMIEGDIIV